MSGSRGGRVAAGVTENVLDKAQSVLDHYLPPEEGHLQDSGEFPALPKATVPQELLGPREVMAWFKVARGKLLTSHS